MSATAQVLVRRIPRALKDTVVVHDQHAAARQPAIQLLELRLCRRVEIRIQPQKRNYAYIERWQRVLNRAFDEVQVLAVAEAADEVVLDVGAEVVETY